MSLKHTCPACGAHLSGVYDALTERRAACPSCGLPGSVMREIEAARAKHADAEVTAQLEAALVRAGKAEAELALTREHIAAIKKAVAEVPDPPDEEYRW